MLTLGIDLSAQDTKTAACLLDWRDGSAVGGAEGLLQGLSDERLLALMDRADTVGLDAPFGWPDRFREMVNEWSANRTWEAAVPRSALRFRLTDEFCVKQGRSPLSVSSDRIAMTAMRCADILARYHERHDVPLDRVNGAVVEVYPAAALVSWGVDVRGYKAPAATDARQTILDKLTTAAGLCLDQEMVARCTTSDHCLDALVCALVARAHAVNLTHPPAPAHREQVAREGWIHLPVSDSLARLTR